MLGSRLEKANEIATKRAARIPRHVNDDFDVPPPSKDHPHKDFENFDAAHLRKWNGSCNCDRYQKLKKRYGGKGKSKRDWRQSI